MEAVVLLVLVFGAYYVVCPALTFLHHERKYRLHWRRQEIVPVLESTPGGPFRDEDGVLLNPRHYISEHRGAPRAVKVTVVVSLVLGHMFLPGLLAGLFGLIFYGIGLVSIPGLILAAGIYSNAFGLLRCDPRAAVRARELQNFSLVLNAVVLGVVVLLFTVLPELAPLLAFTTVYALISIAHAQALGRAADAIEAVHAGVTVPARSAAPNLRTAVIH